MPSNNRQFHLILDDATEEVIFQLVAIKHENPTKVLKDLIASHPVVLEQARIAGLTLDPDSVKHGGNRSKQIKD